LVELSYIILEGVAGVLVPLK